MKIYFSYLLLFAVVLLASCDEGRIYEKELEIPQEGLTLKLTATLTGIHTWSGTYQVVLAAFNGETLSKYKLIDSSFEGKDNFSVTLSGIKDDITELQLCVIERASRKSIIAFQTIEKSDFVATNDTIKMDVGTLDVGMYSSIQHYIFDKKCIGCHGAVNGPRNLHLTEGKSYADLVGKQSSTNPGYKLVDPGNASGSLLPIVLDSNGFLAHDHADMLDARDKSALISLLKSWINNGAKE